MDGAEGRKQANGKLGVDEKPVVTELLSSTPRQWDPEDNYREFQKNEKMKKKKKSLNGEAMDVDVGGLYSDILIEADVDWYPDITKNIVEHLT